VLFRSVDLIGNLQSNKVNKALRFFDSIQSVGSIELLEAIAVRAHERDKKLRLFLELHTGEDSKSGFPDIDSLLQAIESYEASKPTNMIELVGLMTMAPFTNNEKLLRESFRRLYRTRDEVGKRFSLPCFTELSMGMSGDFEIAIEEGSTLLRIGTAIFGERQ
jgi:PLP dependent protein